MIYLVHPTKFEYSQYFLAVQMQLSPSLAASLSFSLPLPHSISLSCSISLFLSLSFAAVSFHLPRPSHLACRSSSFAFACHELPLGSTPGCTAILGLPSPPPALLRSAFALSPPPQRTRLRHIEAPFGCLLIAAASLLTRLYLYLCIACAYLMDAMRRLSVSMSVCVCVWLSVVCFCTCALCG